MIVMLETGKLWLYFSAHFWRQIIIMEHRDTIANFFWLYQERAFW